MALIYKTLKNASPQGKPKVYFCCHPDDFNTYFERISDDILNCESCCIWYYDCDTSTIDDETLFSDIEQMQLFVIPVTTSFLTTPCSSFDREFKFAIEKHIPVLPIIYDESLAVLFNQKCGDLQYLFPSSQDTTTIDYKEKLQKFLSEILIGDELAEQVRQAFDAYVFLSYRKKDRKYARELMELIHENDFCRDIAIWYDEFLTPGENFNDGIKNAIEKSHLFALAVTPNLVNEINYVMTEEFPMARNSNKKILPAEIIPTDQNILKEKYEGIPDCTDAHDKTALSNALLDALSDVAKKENDSSPQHNFFIGLAYLGGIDVEVNFNRAKELIESSANSGYAPALKKLVSMYRMGDGVERNYETAIQWQEKYVQTLEKEYKKNYGCEAGYTYFSEIRQLGKYVNELKVYKKTRKIYRKMLKHVRRFLKKHNTDRGRIYYSIAIENIGYSYEYETKYKRAFLYFLRSFITRYRYNNKVNSMTSRKNLAISYNQLGNMFLKFGKTNFANGAYKEAGKLIDANFKKKNSSEEKLMVAIKHYKLATVDRTTGKKQSALENLEKCIKIREEVYAEENTTSAFSSVISAKRELAMLLKDMSKYDESLELCKEILEMKDELFKKTGTISAKQSLALAYSDLSQIYRLKKQYIPARDNALESLDIFKELSNAVKTHTILENISITYNRLGLIEKELENFDKSVEYLTQAVDASQNLIKTFNTFDAKGLCSTPYYNLADIYYMQKKYDIAIKYCETALSLREEVMKHNDDINSKSKCASSFVQKSNILKELKDINSAIIFLQSAIRIYELLHKTTMEISRKRTLAKHYNNLGALYEKINDIKEAEIVYLKELKLREEIYNAQSPTHKTHSLAKVCSALGRMYDAQKLYSKALTYTGRALTYRKEIEEYEKSGKQFNIISTLCERMAKICDLTGKKTDADKYRNEAAKFKEKLTQTSQQ